MESLFVVISVGICVYTYMCFHWATHTKQWYGFFYCIRNSCKFIYICFAFFGIFAIQMVHLIAFRFTYVHFAPSKTLKTQEFINFNCSSCTNRRNNNSNYTHLVVNSNCIFPVGFRTSLHLMSACVCAEKG